MFLAYLLNCNAEWRDARIHVLSLASNDLMKTQTEQAQARLIPEIRIESEVEVMTRTEHDNIQDMIRQKSFGADVVFLGLATPVAGKEEEYAQRLQSLVEFLPTCFLVHNGSLFIGDLITPQTMPRRLKMVKMNHRKMENEPAHRPALSVQKKIKTVSWRTHII